MAVAATSAVEVDAILRVVLAVFLVVWRVSSLFRSFFVVVISSCCCGSVADTWSGIARRLALWALAIVFNGVGGAMVEIELLSK